VKVMFENRGVNAMQIMEGLDHIFSQRSRTNLRFASQPCATAIQTAGDNSKASIKWIWMFSDDTVWTHAMRLQLLVQIKSPAGYRQPNIRFRRGWKLPCTRKDTPFRPESWEVLPVVYVRATPCTDKDAITTAKVRAGLNTGQTRDRNVNSRNCCHAMI
jgi:hypothetical protein